MNDSYIKLDAYDVQKACIKIIDHVERIRREDIAALVSGFRARKHRILRWRRTWTDEQIKDWLDLAFIKVKVKFWKQEHDAKRLLALCNLALTKSITSKIVISGTDAELLINTMLKPKQ